MTTTVKSNKFAGPCNTCGGTVPAGEGILAGRMVGGNRRWLIRHATDGCTPPAAMPRLRRPAVEDHPCLVHGPADDECLGDRCVTGRRAARTPARHAVAMGFGAAQGVCGRHGNALEAGFRTGCWECDMEADEAHRDRLDGMAEAVTNIRRTW